MPSPLSRALSAGPLSAASPSAGAHNRRHARLLAGLLATVMVIGLAGVMPRAAQGSTPKLSDVHRAEAIAHAKWRANPRMWRDGGSAECQLSYEFRSSPPGTEGGTVSWFWPTSCVIGFDPAVHWTWSALCLTEMHEYGHAVVGPAFAGENPSDPWHTTNPRSILNFRVPNAADSKGCFPKARHARRHR